jgi:hypothetical protein
LFASLFVAPQTSISACIHNRLIFSLVKSRECGPDARHWESTRVTGGTAS